MRSEKTQQNQGLEMPRKYIAVRGSLSENYPIGVYKN